MPGVTAIVIARECRYRQLAMTDAEATELADLRNKMAVRKDQPGFSENVLDIEARIAEIEAATAPAANPAPAA